MSKAHFWRRGNALSDQYKERVRERNSAKFREMNCTVSSRKIEVHFWLRLEQPQEDYIPYEMQFC